MQAGVQGRGGPYTEQRIGRMDTLRASLCSCAQIFQQAGTLIDFLVLHTYPIFYETYAEYSTLNPNFQARQTVDTPALC